MANLPQAVVDFLTKLPYYQELKQFQLFNNSGIDYILIPVIFIIAFIVSYIVKFVFLARLKNFLPERGRDITGPVLKEVRNLINGVLVFFVSLYLATRHLWMTQSFSVFFNVVILGVVLYYLYRFMIRLVDIGADVQEARTEDNQEHILSFIKLVGKVLIASVVLLLYLNGIGINVTGLVAGLGIMGITIAFALQNIVSDLFSAVAIYLDKPFEIGDYIKVGDKVGRIEKIGIRSTHVRSVDGPLIVMSNQNLTKADITNYKKMEERRITQVVGVSADTPIKQLRQLPDKLTKIANSLDPVEVDRVWLKELGNYSWNYEIIYFVEDPAMDVYRNVQEELNFRILELMDEEDIELPYPIQEVLLNGKSSFIEEYRSIETATKTN